MSKVEASIRDGIGDKFAGVSGISRWALEHPLLEEGPPFVSIYLMKLLMKSKVERRYNERGSVSNHWRLGCFLNCSFRRRSKKMLKLRFAGLC